MGTKDSQMSQADDSLDDDRPSNSSDEKSGDTNPRTVDSNGTVEDESTERAEEAEDKPSLDLIFEVLKNSRRREAILYLREQDERVSLGELAEHIAAIENDTTRKQLTSSQRKRVYVGLYQCHLPKMDDIGVVDFNQDRGHVTLTDQVKFFEPYIDHREEDVGRPWYQYYGAISVAGLVAIAGSALGPLSQSVVLGVSVVFVLAVVICAMVHRAVVRQEE